AEDVYLTNFATTGNTASNSSGFDNFLVQFTNTGSLDTSEVTPIENVMAIYPNPVSETLHISTDGRIKSATVFDMSGKKINVNVRDAKVDVSTLQSGNYIITVETDKGEFTDKFIKK